MNVLFLQRSGIDLYATLLASETSRRILRFYQPASCPGGVILYASSFGSALSLAGELRWYIRRYMQDVLLEVSGNRYCTLTLARELYYDRDFTIHDNWPFRRLYVIRKGNLVSALNLTALDDPAETGQKDGPVNRIVVLCSESEYNQEKPIVHGEGEISDEGNYAGEE
ncbi:MAG TPA: DUF5804 family protein [Methanoregulaceae archaeon]|nr:DUF5804 family protein [Methanoregulaceae archaeon]